MFRRAYNNILIFSLILILALLTACGGGGGSGSDGTVIGGSSTTTNAVVTFSKTTLQFADTATVTATFRKSDGSPAAGASVIFTTTLGVLTPVNGTATTDGNGVATVILTSGNTSGQGQVTASATVDGRQVTASGLFTVTLPPLHLSPLTVGLTPISYGGTTSVSVKVLDDNNALYTAQDIDVVFTSTQSTAGKASISSPVRTVNGVATTTYQASTVTGTDTVTATIAGSSQSGSISVTPLAVGSIVFVSAAPANLALKSMGGLGYALQSVVTFKVLNTSGLPSANQAVSFSLSTAVGGITLSQASGSTDASGNVSTIVNSGNVATPVRVKATITGSSPEISTQSDLLTISTGLPTQDGMSVAFATLNSESFNIDGVENLVSVYLADHFGNPVPDGTAVSFSAQSGIIEPNCTTGGTANPHGVCTVKWRSSGLRPADGKNGILVYALGEESFVDLNGNGLADGTCVGGSLTVNLLCGEFTDTLQPWRDDAHTGVYSPAFDPFIDTNGSGLVNRDAKFNGVLVIDPSATNLKHVFKNPVIVMSTSAADITITAGDPINSTPETITILVEDLNGNQMPAGTTITLSATVGTLSSTSFVVPNTTAAPAAFNVIWSISPVPAVPPSGSVTIFVTTPAGVTTTRTIPISL